MPLGGLTVEQVEEELSDFSCKFDGEEEFVEKLNALSCQFHLEADDVINELMAYATNQKRTDLDVGFLDSFEAYYAKKKATVPSTVSKSRTVLADLRPTTLGTPSRRQTMKMETSMVEEGEGEMDTTLPRFDCTNVPAHLTEFVIKESAAGAGWFVNRPDAGRVMAKVGGEVEMKNGKKTSLPVTVRQHVPPGKQTYGEPKAAAVLEGMNARLDGYGRDVRAANGERIGEAPFVPLNAAGESEVFIIGFVVEFDARGDVSTIDVQRDEEEGAASVTVDVTGLDERCFFPGQLVVLKGMNRTGSLFEATERYSAPAQSCARVGAEGADAVVWAAAGPFTPPTTATYEPLAELAHAACTAQPDVLLLIGPLVDAQAKFITSKDCPGSVDELTKSVLERVATKMKGSRTRVIYMPCSSKDAAVVPVFPGATLRKEWNGGVVEVVSDPCTITVGGVEIAVTASDVLTHLSRAECYTSSNKENTDRMKRVAGHMLEQRSLYPLHPPSLSACLEGVNTACPINDNQPHVIIAPSMFAAFVKSSFGSMVVNPGTACRGTSVGTVMKMRIGLSEISPEGATNLEKYTHVSIAKI